MRERIALALIVLALGCGGAFSQDKETQGFGGWSWAGPKRHWSYEVVHRTEGPVRAGETSERFEIRAGDCGRTGDYNDCAHDREHIALNETSKTRLGKPVWYSFSVFIPQETPIVIGTVNVILAEFRPTGPGQINLSIELQQGALVAVVGSTHQQQKNDMKPPPPAVWQPLEYPQNGRWYDFVVEAIWSTGNDGKLKIYVGDKLKLQFEGPNTAFERPVHMQYGVYRPFVSKSKQPLPRQVFFFDNIMKSNSPLPLTASGG